MNIRKAPHMLHHIKLMRKAFLTDFLKIHYSQFGEDIILREILKDSNDGFFVDVGCYHPKKFSNTYKLYKRGWRGVNIDMEEDKIKLFNMVRRQDHNVCSPVSDTQEEVTLVKYSKFGLDSTIDKEIASQSSDQVYDSYKVKTRTLNEILDNSPYRGRQIDVLSVDVEGMDYRVLKSLNFETYKPKVVIVEDHNKSIEEILNTNTYKHLKSLGYVLRSWTFYSLIFILPGSDILKDRENKIS